MMTGFEQYTRKTRRAIFLEEMEQVVPWRELCALVAPHYPQPGKGRRPVGVERMLRIYFLQQWFNLSDPGVEEALYDSAVMRQFVGIDLGCEPAPDETTVCKFRHLLEAHQLGEQILGQVNLHLQAQGVRITTGTIEFQHQSCIMTHRRRAALPVKPPSESSSLTNPPEQHPYEHVSDQADDNEIRRWVALGDAILSRGAPTEQQISEMISLARNEQARIKRKMRPIVRIFKQSQSKH